MSRVLVESATGVSERMNELRLIFFAHVGHFSFQMTNIEMPMPK